MAILSCPPSSPRFVPLAAAPYPVSLTPVPTGTPPAPIVPPRQLFPHWLDREPRTAQPSTPPSAPPRALPIPVVAPVIHPAQIELFFDAANLPPVDDETETVEEMRARFDAECAAFQQFEAMYLAASRERARAYYRRNLSPEVLALLAEEEEAE